MSIPVQNLIRSAQRNKGEPLRILWLPKDGIFEYFLFNNVPHQYFGSHNIELQTWDTVMFSPQNFHTLFQHNTFSLDNEFDLIVCNHRMNHVDHAKVLSHILHIPILLIEHELPFPIMKKEDIFISKQDKVTHFNIVCHDEVNTKWKTNYGIIPYGIPDLYQQTERKEQILLIGTFLDSDIKLVKEIQKKSEIPVKIFGSNNPNVATSLRYDELVKELQESKYYLNITSYRNIPLMLLLAMSAGCVPVSNINLLLKNIVTEDTGFVFQDMNSMFETLHILKGKDTTKQSINSHNLIQKMFPLNSFIENWTKLFDTFYDYVYVR